MESACLKCSKHGKCDLINWNVKSPAIVSYCPYFIKKK